MADSHDPMCPQHGQTMRSIIAFDTPCRCEFIDRVRADERATAQVQACDAHISQVRWAEAVAAKLVEAICDRESDYRNALWELGVAHDMHDAVTEVLYQTRAEVERVLDERDAARAEVVVLREQADRYDFITATLLVRLHDEVLADLRAKIMAEREEDARYVHSDDSASARIAAYDAVLVMIKEVEQ